ncbi:MAG: hypothetical protein GXP62_01370 [Oligoflexia bacterium]|nr:hypothetical protein [Oligoflexia bacterium]
MLLPQLGLSTTTWIAASGNAMLCMLALSVAKRAGELAPAPTRRTTAGRGFVVLAAVASLAGLAGLIYEVAWFRVLGLNLGGSAYSFTIMLLAFLIGIAGGGWWGGGIADRVHARFGVSGVLRSLAVIEAGVAVLAWAAMYLYGELPFAFTWVYAQVEPNLGWLWPGQLLMALAIMLPPALLMGAAFPFLVRAAATDGRHGLGGPVGALYGWNTVGGIVGAGVGSLIMLPMLSVTTTVLVAISLNLAAAVLVLVTVEQRLRHRKLAIGWILAGAWAVGLVAWKPPPWNKLLMTAGMYKYASDLTDRSRQGVLNFAVLPYDLLFYDEGLSSVVTVARSRKKGNMWLANNGKIDASSGIDMPTQVLCAQLPFAFRPDARDVVVIGLASGITAGAVTLHPGLRRIDIVELEPAVVKASHFFDALNHHPLEDPRTHLYANDGRNHINLAADGTYDVVVSEPSNPWLSGVSNLFTQEFLEQGKRKLKPGGVWSQWVQMYGMDEDDLRSLVGTFAQVYPYIRLFSTIDDADLVLIGSESPLSVDEADLARLFQISPAINRELQTIGIFDATDLLTRYQKDRQGVLAFVGDVPVNTDDNMRIEYSAPLHLHEDTADANFQALLGPKEDRKPPLFAVHGSEGLKRLARAYARRGRWIEALIAIKAAYRQAPEDPELPPMYEAWQNQLLRELAQADDDSTH